MSSSMIILIVAATAGLLAGLLLRIIVLRKLPALFRSAAPVLASGFFQPENLQSLLSAPGNFESIRPLAEAHVDEFLNHKLGKEMPVIGMFIGEKTIAQLKAIFMKELEEIFPLVINKYLGNLSGELQQQAFVSRQLALLTDAHLRVAMANSLKKYLNILPFGGMLMGIVTGALQLLILFLLV